MQYARRLSRVTKKLVKTGLDAAIFTSWESLYYLTGMKPIQSRSLSRDPMPLVVYSDRKDPTFIPTAAFGMAAKLEHKNVVKDIRPFDGPEMWTMTSRILNDAKLYRKKVGIESRYLTFSHFATLQQKAPDFVYTDCSDIIEEERMIKDSDELRLIEKACHITDKVVEAVSSSHLKVGMTELDIAGEIIRTAIEYGAEGESFHPQVFSGRRGYLLNISSSKKKVERGEVVMLDFGVNVEGYRTDTTRCFVLGKAKQKHKEISAIALKITQDAVDAVKPEMRASDVHKRVLRDFRKVGFEGYCRHYSGHGIGLSTWERPVLREFDTTKIKENMTLAVEQGIYLPDFGVRFEENLIVTRNGNKSLFKYPAELVELGS